MMINNDHIPIFLSSDDKFSPYMATTIASICYNSKFFIDIYILDGGISKFHKMQIMILSERFNNLYIEFIPIDLNLFKDYPLWMHIESLSMYSRLLIPNVKQNINKAIYLDSDLIVLDDIAKLYDVNLDGYCLAAIAGQENNTTIKNIKCIAGLNDSHIYFNSGVLLFDCNKCREQDIVHKMIAIATDKKRPIHCADQDILNICFENNYKKLDVIYNVCHNTKCKNPVIRHFTGSEKPWLANGVYKDGFMDFWFFASFTPFYAGIQAYFIASQHNNMLSNQIIGKIKKPDKPILNYLRSKIKSG
jgi:lipopolysaccharide biosynthesis glycosyltransferase